MIKFGLLLFIAFIMGVLGYSQNLQPSLDSLKKHVNYLASSELKGRNTGEIGQRIAAQYIASSFKQFGLKPYTENGYYQYYDLLRKNKNYLRVKNSNNILFWPWHFYFVSGFNHSDTVNSKLVFVGYATDLECSQLDLNNKAIALLAENGPEAYQTIKKLSKNYATTTFFVIFPKQDKNISHAWSIDYELSTPKLRYKFDDLNLQKPTEAWAINNDSLNVFYCFQNVLKNVFMLSDAELEKIAIDNIEHNDSSLRAIIQPDIVCCINYSDSVETLKVENVVGLIKGEDTSKTIVVSAHYDHVGEEAGLVNYGADDNASGTAALLECARLLGIDAKKGIKPKTNVLFVAFSGEELGLLGSKAFVRDESTNLSSIKLNVNLDMIGRWDKKHEKNKNFVYLLTAGEKSKELAYIGRKQLILPQDFTVSTKPGGHEKVIFKYGSDHYSFLEKGISISVFFTGLHDDYHTPRDTPEKINFENLTNITDVVYQYIYKVSELK